MNVFSQLVVFFFTLSKNGSIDLLRYCQLSVWFSFLLRLDNCLDSLFLHSIQRPNEYISVFSICPVREQLVLAVADDDAENDVNGMFSD